MMKFLIVDPDPTIRNGTCDLIEAEGHSTASAASAPESLTALQQESCDAVLLDSNLAQAESLDLLAQIQQTHPRVAVVMMSARGTIRSAVEAMQRGALDFLEKPFRREQFVSLVGRVHRWQRIGDRIDHLEDEVNQARSNEVDLLLEFSDPLMQEALEILSRASSTPASLLILGESGTGKSAIARMVHERSHLADQPFVTVSCPSLSRELLESELFGHVKGSFTGAIKDRWGKVKAAEGGTLFLDEIGDLPLELQPKLLRLLQEREYERLGETVTRTAVVRVIAATNRDLTQRLRERLFRDDLYYRLNAVTVEIPPLRKRPQDLMRLAEHFATRFAQQCGRTAVTLTEEARVCLRCYPWPGNLREMRNVIERAVILAREERIYARDLPPEMHLANIAASNPEVEVGAMVSLERLEETHIRRVLHRIPNVREAAERLGIDQATLYRKRRRFGI
jgi:NtrC-family two-component system response regulator AlgB